ncbi:MAG: hypothetical protein HZA35_04175 [Parcubacteria group bacterium]|nr:hypothetical protein [Parcubacteria group bacterium]
MPGVIPRMHNGLFVLFEGLSGSGKSTQAELFYARLKEKDIPALLNREPAGGIFGRIIRNCIEKKDIPRELLFKAGYRLAKLLPKHHGLVVLFEKLARGGELTELERQTIFVLDRLEDIKDTISPALKAGKIVVQDRYDLSTYAYYMASSGSEKAFAEIAQLHQEVLSVSYVVPDITFIIDLAAETATQRLHTSGKVIDIYEHEAFLARVRNHYQTLATRKNPQTQLHVLDGEKSKDDMNKKVCEILDWLFIAEELRRKLN